MIKITHSKVWEALVLNTVCGYLNDLRVFCFVMVVHESLVCSEQLNRALFFRKVLHVQQILEFSSIFCIFEPFPAATV